MKRRPARRGVRNSSGDGLDVPPQMERILRWYTLTERQILRALSERELAVWVLYAIRGLQIGQIAGRLGLPPRTVADALGRAQGKLQRLLRQD